MKSYAMCNDEAAGAGPVIVAEDRVTHFHPSNELMASNYSIRFGMTVHLTMHP